MLVRTLVLALIAAGSGLAMDPIRYTVRFPAPQTHYAEIEAVYPAAGRSDIELMMAVWTPGSYLVRDYAGKVEGVQAFDSAGGELAVAKTRKNRWRVETGGSDAVRLRYRLYCREMSVRTNWVENDFAILNGASTFITLIDPAADKPAAAPHEVSLELPSNWPLSHAALARSAGENSYIADDFDTLVDSPIFAGDLAIYPFQAEGAEHFLVNLGEGGVFDGARAAADVEKLTAEQIRFWGQTPYASYSFLNAITEAGGGLEHKASTLVMTSRWATRTRKTYVRWLKLISHEFFHTWNVKRLRPVELGPFDYERENHTTGLWMGEGFTSYYESVLLRRAGLITDKEMLEALSEDVATLQNGPGRLVQPVGESSYDAWIKLYRQDENTPNSVVSYYVKGAVIALLLDARIRATDSGKSLDDVMRLAYERYSGDRGFTADEFFEVIRDAAGADHADWVRKSVNGTDELDYAPLLDAYGLVFKTEKSENGDQPDEPPAWLGVKTAVKDGRLVVTQALAKTPAREAGLNVDDEILAINDYRVPPNGLEERLARFRPGEELRLLVARREQLTTIAVVAAKKPAETWSLEVDPKADEAAQQRFRAWVD